FEPDGAMLHDLRHVVCTDVNIWPSDDEQHTGRRTFDEAASGFENHDASAFGSDEGASHVETVFREQVVKVVSGNATRNIGKLAPHLLAIAIRERPESGVDLGAPSAFPNEEFEVIGVGSAHVHALAAIGENLERIDIVVRFAGHDRVHAAGIVADHASECAAVVRGRIGSESKMVLLGGGTEIIENDSRLDARDAACRIDLEDARHVFGKVEYDGGVTTLSSKRRASTARE